MAELLLPQQLPQFLVAGIWLQYDILSQEYENSNDNNDNNNNDSNIGNNLILMTS